MDNFGVYFKLSLAKMKNDLRIVTNIPLKEIWNDEILVSRVRKRYIEENDIKELLRQGPANFIVGQHWNQFEMDSRERLFFVLEK